MRLWCTITMAWRCLPGITRLERPIAMRRIGTQPRSAAPRRPSRRALLATAAACAAPSAITGVAHAQFFTARPAFRAGDWLLLARIDNRSGDAALDGWIVPALEVTLSQSRHVNVAPRRRVASLLRSRGQKPDTVLDDSTALDLASAGAYAAVLVGEVAGDGTGLTVTMRLLDTRQRATAWRASATAVSHDRIGAAFDELLRRLRAALGESADAIRSASLPLAEATSASLPALARWADSLRFTEGTEAEGHEALRQAIAHDAQFALAMAALAIRQYQRSGRSDRQEAERLVQRALALPQRLTARDRLWVQAQSDDGLGQRDEAVLGYKALLAQYPDDTRAWFRLGWTYMAGLKRCDEAVAAFSRVTELDPFDAGAWTNLATCYGTDLRRHGDAVATYQKAFALDPELQTRMYVNGEYGAALVHLGQLDTARANFEKMLRSGDPVREARGHRSMAFWLMHQGRYRAAIVELEQALALNRARNLTLSLFRDHVIKSYALLALGAQREAGAELTVADAFVSRLSLGPEWLSRMVRLHARLGDADGARRLVERMTSVVGVSSTDTTIGRNLADDQGYLDLARGEVALLQGQVTAATQHAASAAARIGRADVIGLQARAHEAAGAHDAAIARYRELADIAPFGYEEQEEAVQARFALAASLERLGRVDEARAQYQRLLAPWAEGDAELVLLVRARARLRALAR